MHYIGKINFRHTLYQASPMYLLERDLSIKQKSLAVVVYQLLSLESVAHRGSSLKGC